MSKKGIEVQKAFEEAKLSLAKLGSLVGDLMMEKAEQPPAELIQGYTAEQWQEIIDGGYLCEVRDFDTEPWTPAILKEIVDPAESDRFKVVDANDVDGLERYDFCRPAQIKGVMRPIFVKPESDVAWCIFFDENNDPINRGRWVTLGQMENFLQITKYIEV